MADPEEHLKRSKQHEQHMSRLFDEVMGLGEFADSSRGSVSSSRSSGHEERSQGEEEERETRGGEESSGKGGGRQGGEEDSNGSGREERMEDADEEAPLPHVTSPSLDRHSPLTVETSGGGEAGAGGAGFDDDLEALPVYGAEEEEEEDEDWHYALPMETPDDADANKPDKRSSQSESRNREVQEDPITSLPVEKEQEKGGEKEGEKGGSIASADTSHSSQDPENSQDGVVEQCRETDNSQQGGKSDMAAEPDGAPPPVVNIKDEPIDEGYDAALLPHSSARNIKEELETQEEELRISSVYSVTGGESAFISPTVPPPVQAPMQTAAPHPTAIFIPGRGGLATLPLRPLVPVQAMAPLPQVPPPQPPAPGTAVRCSGCSKILLKGQTAFQRKGSTQLFCSTVCLTGYLPPTSKARSCYQCLKEITQPKDMIMTPIDANNYMHFCSQFCLSVFNRKKKPEQKQPEKPCCSVCRVMNKIEHEVLHQGRVHRLCSDSCFLTWRRTRQLAMNCCEGCGLYCKTSSASCQTLTIDKSQLSFCSATCIGTFKRTCSKTTQCANCHNMTAVCSTLMERDQKGKVQLYCSALCVEHSRPPKHTLTGTPFPCSLCKKTAVPQYHLAMVDGSIRNFCCLDCVTTYRKTGPSSQPNPDRDLANGTSSSAPRDPFHRDAPRLSPSAGVGPYGQSPHPSQPSKASSSVPPIPQDFSPLPYPGHHPGHTSVPPLLPPTYPPLPPPSAPDQGLPRVPLPGLQHPKPGQPGGNEVFKLTCHQCSKQFSTKPQLFNHQGCVSVFCGKACSEQYKAQRNIVASCSHCHLEKIIYDFITYSQQDHAVCSPSCKLLYKDELAQRNKEQPWRSCSYCSSLSQKTLHSHYSGKMEEFCRPDCMSQYTVLFYGMARCDSCRKQGDMTEKLQCSGSVRNFCSLPCLLQFCHQHFESSQHSSSNGTTTGPALPTPYGAAQPHNSKVNPVIATDAVSLDNGSANQPHVTADSALTGSLPTPNTHDKNLDNASTQTDAMRVPVARRRQMKNKAVMCRPVTLDQETLYQLPTSDTDVQTDQLASPARPADPSPEPPREAPPCQGLPARLTGRHFLGRREKSTTDCIVCSHRKRKRAEEEEERKEEKRESKRGKMEEGERRRGKMEEERKRGKMEEEGEKKMMEEKGEKKMEEEEGEKKKMEEEGEKKMEEGEKKKKMEEEGEKKKKMEEEREKKKKMEAEGEKKMEEGEKKKTEEEVKKNEGERSSKEEEVQRKEVKDEERRETVYYCKTCPSQPSLCPTPCFELYHTKLLYKMAAELDTLAC